MLFTIFVSFIAGACAAIVILLLIHQQTEDDFRKKFEFTTKNIIISLISGFVLAFVAWYLQPKGVQLSSTEKSFNIGGLVLDESSEV